jgi:hypothetical protein
LARPEEAATIHGSGALKLVGSWLSVRHLPSWAIRYGLAALLVVAGTRMLASR